MNFVWKLTPLCVDSSIFRCVYSYLSGFIASLFENFLEHLSWSCYLKKEDKRTQGYKTGLHICSATVLRHILLPVSSLSLIVCRLPTRCALNVGIYCRRRQYWCAGNNMCCESQHIYIVIDEIYAQRQRMPQQTTFSILTNRLVIQKSSTAGSVMRCHSEVLAFKSATTILNGSFSWKLDQRGGRFPSEIKIKLKHETF